MIYFKKGNVISEYKNKKELYNDVGVYNISKVGVWHSYTKTVRHYGEIGISYLERVSRNYNLAENISFYNGRLVFEQTGWNIFDEKGVYYSIVDFIEYYEEEVNKRLENYLDRKYGSWNGVGPVPCTSKRKCYKYYNYIRFPKTYHEIRNNQRVDSDEPEIRAKRKPRNIVTSWSDFSKERYKNWKCYRKTQYRG